mgnify:CR=1 FL=1
MAMANVKGKGMLSQILGTGSHDAGDGVSDGEQSPETRPGLDSDGRRPKRPARRRPKKTRPKRPVRVSKTDSDIPRVPPASEARLPELASRPSDVAADVLAQGVRKAQTKGRKLPTLFWS